MGMKSGATPRPEDSVVAVPVAPKGPTADRRLSPREMASLDALPLCVPLPAMAAEATDEVAVDREEVGDEDGETGGDVTAAPLALCPGPLASAWAGAVDLTCDDAPGRGVTKKATRLRHVSFPSRLGVTIARCHLPPSPRNSGPRRTEPRRWR
jgi:hypothetical protein